MIHIQFSINSFYSFFIYFNFCKLQYFCAYITKYFYIDTLIVCFIYLLLIIFKFLLLFNIYKILRKYLYEKYLKKLYKWTRLGLKEKKLSK